MSENRDELILAFKTIPRLDHPSTRGVAAVLLLSFNKAAAELPVLQVRGASLSLSDVTQIMGVVNRKLENFQHKEK